MEEPLLAHLDPLPALHLLLEVEHRLVGFDVVRAGLALLVPEEHLDGGPLSDQQGHPGAGVHTVEGERLGVVAEGVPLSVVYRQTLLVTSDSHFLLDAVFQRAHRVLGVHHQVDCVPIEHDDFYFHDDDDLQDRILTLLNIYSTYNPRFMSKIQEIIRLTKGARTCRSLSDKLLYYPF